MSLLRKSCAMATIVFGWAIWTLPRTAGAASLSAPLVQCASVAVPGALPASTIRAILK
jgi:hypothetical protein